MIEKGRVLVCDIDGTIVNIKNKDQEYKDLEPIESVVKKIRSLKSKGWRIIFSTARNMRTYNGDIDWIKETAKGLGISSCSFHVRDNLSKGQAETVYDSVKTLSEIDRDVLWIYNIDTYVKSGIRKNDMLNSDGCLHVYHSTLPNLSFVDYDASGSVSNVVEKSPISTWASVGSYGFSSVGLYKKIYEEAYFNQKAKVVYGEQYIAPMYKVMLDLGMDVAAPKLQDELVHILGTPEDLDRFKSVF